MRKLAFLAGMILPIAAQAQSFDPYVSTKGGTAIVLSNAMARELSPFDFGAKCDGLEYLNTFTSAGTTTIGTASVQVPASAIGKPIVLVGVGHTPAASDIYVDQTSALSAAGTNYAVNDTVTFTGGTIIKVDTLSGSAIATFHFTTYGAYTATAGTLAQTATSGIGTGAVLTPVWRGPPKVTTITATGGSGPSSYTITVASAPTITATIPDAYYGTDDGAALQSWITSAANNGISHIQIPASIPGTNQPSRCLTGTQLELPTNGNPYNNNPIIEGTGFDGAAIYPLASMANVIHSGTTARAGGGLRDIVIDGNGLVTNAVVQIVGARGYRIENSQIRDATGAAYNLEIGDGSTATADFQLDGVKAWTNTSNFSDGQMPAKDVYISAGATDGTAIDLVAANALTNNIQNDGAGNYFFHAHPFNTTYPNLVPTDGIEVSAQGHFYATECDNAIGTNSCIHVNSTGSVIRGSYIGCNAASAVGLYGVDIASSKGRNIVDGTTYETACNLLVQNAVHQTGTASSTTIVCNNMGAGYSACGPTATFGATFSAPAWTTNGLKLITDNSTITDTSSSGTVAEVAVNKMAGTPIAASSATTFTTSETLNIQPPTAGANATLSNIFALKLGGDLHMGSGNIKNVSTIQMSSYVRLATSTVAGLPTCNGTNEGDLMAVTDANSAVFNAAVAAGGANHMIAYCNGTGWVVH